MSSNILHVSTAPASTAAADPRLNGSAGLRKHPFLVRLGERVRRQRNGRGMTRRELALAAGVSERHLGNLELGVGNASVLILLQVAQALHCSPADLLAEDAQSPEWSLIRELLHNLDEAALRRVREAITPVVHAAAATSGGPRPTRVALVGLRGAGKSTLGAMLAHDLGYPFLELSREIENFAGCTVPEIQSLYGQNAYRRYERRALEEAIQIHPEAVIAVPGGLVAEPATFNLLLSHCTTVWLKASPEDHMHRVQAQGDLRPMAGNEEAMADLRGILEHRTPFYAKAELHLDTSAGPLDECFVALRRMVRRALGLATPNQRQPA